MGFVKRGKVRKPMSEQEAWRGLSVGEALDRGIVTHKALLALTLLFKPLSLGCAF
jgi:hypothetical protein